MEHNYNLVIWHLWSTGSKKKKALRMNFAIVVLGVHDNDEVC